MAPERLHEPERYCDLVMKGGITSGVVYPLAVCELARAFRFKNIGGTSAGAIAAAAAAAAELGRYRNQGGRFSLLAGLPQFLSSRVPGESRTNLFGFFQPQKKTASVFHTCIAALGGGRNAWSRVLLAAGRTFWIESLAGAIPGLLLVWFAWWNSEATLSLVTAVVGGLIALLGAVFAAAAVFVATAVKEIPANLFGLCTGMPGALETKADALTPWLTRFLNELAGLKPEGDPLTFGHLWSADPSTPAPTINLEMVTTCLTHGRPYRLPFRDDEDVRENKQFFFRRSDFEQLFPERVLRWMEDPARSAASEKPEREAEFRQAGFIPLPKPEHLPVVVAVRMSLSFPILLSAVPLYAVDYSRKNREDQWPERCWFSDGGISSNFPVHFFDAALPRWPTFGMDLTEQHPDYEAGFYMPNSNSAGTLVKWKRFDTGSGLQRLLGFLAGIVMTSKDWADNAQCRLPGFRDRIGQVSLTPLDGGLNLDMPEERIRRLCSYGEEAGREFVRRFATADPGSVLDWKNHRRVRLRSALAAIEEWLLKLERGCAEPQADDPPYPVLIEEAKPPAYPWNNQAQRELAAAVLAQLRAAAARLQSPPRRGALKDDSPRPLPELRMRPRI